MGARTSPDLQFVKKKMEGCEVIFELVFVTDLDILNPCSFTF